MATKYTIKGNYGSYTFTETVIMEDDDDRNVFDVMWARFRRYGYLTLGMASRSARIVEEEYISDEGEFLNYE